MAISPIMIALACMYSTYIINCHMHGRQGHRNMYMHFMTSLYNLYLINLYIFSCGCTYVCYQLNYYMCIYIYKLNSSHICQQCQMQHTHAQKPDSSHHMTFLRNKIIPNNYIIFSPTLFFCT